MIDLAFVPQPIPCARDAQSRAAHARLAALLHAHGICATAVERTPSGRPFPVGLPHVDFSISHTQGLSVVALCTVPEGENAPRIGVDVEHIGSLASSHIMRLAERFFAPCERAFLETHKDDVLHAFATVFTRKEALAKCRGGGLSHHLRTTDTMQEGFEQAEHVRFSTPDAPAGYCITLCTQAQSSL